MAELDAGPAGAEQARAELGDWRDREQIRELRARYAWHAARGEPDGLLALFTADGLFEIPGSPRKRGEGIEGIRTLVAHIRPSGQVPLISNEIIRITGDVARGSCAMFSPVSGSGPAMCGYYLDRFARVAGAWRFTERRFFLYLPAFEQPGGGAEAGYH